MRHLTKWLFFLGLFISGSACAIVDIELTQGVQGAIPIAVVPFSGQSDADSANNISNIITQDLQNSGRFRLMNKSEMQQLPNSADKVDFSYWQKQNLNNLVVGSVESVGGDQYRVQFQLLNAYANKQNRKDNAAPGWQSSVILSNSFTVNGSQLRAVAHHISDLIYQSLTGDRGVFSTRIAYVVAQQSPQGSQYTLEVSDMDGYNPKPLLTSSQSILSPAWSPDGRRIAYVSFESGRAAIYVQDVTSGSRQLVSNFAGLNNAPAWSPDGRRLAIVLTRTGYPKIFIMDVNSRQVTQATQGDSIDTEPNWSEDGRVLYFTSSRGGGPQIYRQAVAGGSPTRVTFNGDYNASGSLSPDGKTLAVLNGSNNRFNIGVQDIASGRYTILTRSGNDQSPSIAPNGKMIIYATQSGGRGVLGMVSTDGRVKIILPARQGDVREPAWGPFLTN